MKTQEAIKAEVAKLRELKPQVRQRTYFGDDNWNAIDAEIKVLEEGMHEDKIWDEWPDTERGPDLFLRDAAIGACNWMNDDPDTEAPSVGWQALIVPDERKKPKARGRRS